MPPTTVPSELENERAIDAVCMRLGYASMTATGPATGVAATVVALLLSRELPWVSLAIWAGVAWALAIARAGLAIWFGRTERTDDQTRAFFPVYSLVMGLAALNWGVLVVVTGFSTSPFVVGLVLLVILGMMSAGAQSIAMTPGVFRNSVLLSLFPICVHLLLSRDPVLEGFLVMTLAHVLAMVASVRGNNATVRDAARLRFENRDLVRALTEEKAREAAAREAAERASQQKSSFLAAASHDVRQPLHALGLFVDALKSRELPEDVERVVASMEAAHESLVSLHEGLLDVSRLDAGAIVARPRAVRATEVVERIALEASPRAREKGLVLRVVAADVVLRTDPELLLRILRNLVANAITYTSQGRVLVAVRRRGDAALIQVWDTGIGIPSDQLERIFDELHQVGNRAREREQGLGLGLAIVRRLATLLGTEVRVRSRLGRGSVFELTVPRVLREGSVVVRTLGRASAPTDAPPSVAPGSIALVVDDDALARKAVASTLERWGYEVVVARSVAEAVEHAGALPRLDLLVSDLWLPDRSGLELASAIARPGLRTIVTTGDTDPRTAEKVRAAGVRLLPKPVRASQLREAAAGGTEASA